jgi:hypothetical protein
MKNKIIILLISISFNLYSWVDFKNNSGLTEPHTYQPGNKCEKAQFVRVSFQVNSELTNYAFYLIRSTSSTFASGQNTWINTFNSCGTCGAGTFSFDDYGIGGGFPGNVFPNIAATYYYKVEAMGQASSHQDFYIGSYTTSGITSEYFETQVANSFVTSSTSNNENSYSWNNYADLTQGVNISLVPTEVTDIYIEQNNAKLNFVSEASYPFISLEVNINNTSYSTIYSGASKTSFVWTGLGALNNLGTNNLKLRYTGQSGAIIYREYRVNTVPVSLELHKSNNCDEIRMYGDPLRPDGVPIVISEGFDAYNTTPIQFYRFAGNDLVNCLISKGFKVYILNYKYNSQDMRNNAAIYSSGIRYISSINNNISVVSAGISMGGVIARYALAKAEDNNIPLPTYKFVSIDSPQQGAVISSQLQAFKKSQQQSANNATFLLHGLNNDAAKELLIDNTFDSNHSITNAFYTELNNLNGNGYPHLTKNIGVAFSNPNPQNILGSTWLTINGLNPLYQFNVHGFTISPDENQAGSYLPTSSTNIDPITRFLHWTLNNTYLYPLNTIDVTFSRYLNPTFIPHKSALDIVNGNSKFDNVIYTANTTFHDQVPSDIIEPLVNAIIKEDVYIQNRVYTANRTTIANKNIYAGLNVNNAATNGLVTVNSNLNVVYKAGESVHLKDGFDATFGSDFEAKIELSILYCDGSSEYQSRKINDKFPQVEREVTIINREQENEISIFPNPSSGYLSFNMFTNENAELLITIEDISGKLLLSQKVNPTRGYNQNELNISDFVNGIYIIKISSCKDGNLIKTAKIILQK